MPALQATSLAGVAGGSCLAHARYPVSHPLVPSAMRPVAAALLIGCVAVTALLGALLAHHTREGALDAAADAVIRAGVGGHPAALNRLAMTGDWLFPGGGGPGPLFSSP